MKKELLRFVSKAKKVLKNLEWYDWLFIVLILVSFITRLTNHSIPTGISGGDTGRDYLIAKEMIGSNPLGLNEFPLLGPVNAMGLINSPAYFYFLSFWLFFNDSLFFLNLVNMVLQMAIPICIYLVARSTLGGIMGLFTSLLFSFDLMILRQGIHMWQPWLMQPFLYLSYLFLFLAWKKENINMLYLAMPLALFAGALHNSAFAVFPALFALAVLILKKMNGKKKDYFNLGLIVLLCLLILYIGPIRVIYDAYLSSPGEVRNILTLERFEQNIVGSFQTLPDIRPRLHWLGLDHAGYQWLLFVVLFVSLFFKKIKDKNFKVLITAGVLSVMPVIFLTLLGQEWPQANHYTALSAGVFYFFIIGSLYFLFDVEKHERRKKVVVSLMILTLLLIPGQIVAWRGKMFGAPNMYDQVQEASEKMAEEVLRLQKEDGFEDLNFFILRGVHGVNSGAGHMFEGIFWLSLEDILNEKFVYITRNGSYETINSNQYVFLICVSNRFTQGDEHDCRNAYFSNLYPFSRFDSQYDYSFDKVAYSNGPITIYLGKSGIKAE